MKKNILLITLLLYSSTPLLLTSCHKEKVDENTFMITPKVIKAHTATFEVVPITNEFYYEADALPLSTYQRLGERGVADLMMRYTDSLKAVLDAQHIPYNNDYLYYKGLFDCTTTYDLTASSPCIFFVMRLSKRTMEPIFPLATYPFMTKEHIEREMSFDFDFRMDTLYVTPSADYPYVWDYVSKKELVEEYDNNPLYYLRTALSLYEEYGFIDEFISQGPEHENVREWYPNLQPGDSIYGIAVGYEQSDETTTIYSKAFVIK